MSETFTLSKRLLGLILLIGGAGGFGLLLVLDRITGATEGGIGPAQQIAIALCIIAALIGASLIPLGRKPA